MRRRPRRAPPLGQSLSLLAAIVLNAPAIESELDDMKSIQLHPLALALPLGLFPLLSVAQQSRQAQPIPQLTPEQREILSHMSIVYLDDGFGNKVNKTIRITGANVQIVNGLGSTNGFPSDPCQVNLGPGNAQVNGLGNLIVGYNESISSQMGLENRTGSHNLIVGTGNDYSSFGGICAGHVSNLHAAYGIAVGRKNTVDPDAFYGASVGGWDNCVEDTYAATLGGLNNRATEIHAVVVGGRDNVSAGEYATICGGLANITTGDYSVIAGGQNNEATGDVSTTLGGFGNDAQAGFATSTGGLGNEADGAYSVVSGGSFRQVSSLNTSGNTDHDWVAGALWEDF